MITTDKYFAQYRDENHYGILVIRLKQPNKLRTHQRIMQAINVILLKIGNVCWLLCEIPLRVCGKVKFEGRNGKKRFC